MANGWAKEGAVQDQIDATIKDAVSRARGQLAQGPALAYYESCGEKIPAARQKAIAGVRLCVKCQAVKEK